MELSQPADWVAKPFQGYVINTVFSDENTRELETLIKEISTTFGDAVFPMPNVSLHTTLLDWIAPLVDYGGKDKEALFAQIQPGYDRALREVLSSFGPINVHFDELRVSPSAIIIVGHDNGEFQSIREQFLDRVQLLPGTKLPPTIIHSSLARFTESIELDLVKSFLATKTISFTQQVSDFRLVHTAKEPMLEFEVLKQYQLR